MIRNVLCPVLSGRVILLSPAWEKLQLRYVTLPWLKISGSQQIRGLAMAEKKDEKKKDMYDFPVHDCSQEQHGGPYFLPSLDDADVRLSIQTWLLPW